MVAPAKAQGKLAKGKAAASPAAKLDGVAEPGAAELEEIEVSDISEHSARFEALHEKLQESLKSIDNL